MLWALVVFWWLGTRPQVRLHIISTMVDWYYFATESGYGIAVPSKYVPEAYAADSKTDDPELAVLIEWVG